MEKDLGACLRPGQAALEMTDYGTLNARLSSLIKGVPHPTANLANAAALLYHTLDGLNWAGFYLLEGDTLVLGPFQGKPACIEIPLGRGVCGAAAAQGRTPGRPPIPRAYRLRQRVQRGDRGAYPGGWENCGRTGY